MASFLLMRSAVRFAARKHARVAGKAFASGVGFAGSLADRGETVMLRPTILRGFA
jgi:hypothetical protein